MKNYWDMKPCKKWLGSEWGKFFILFVCVVVALSVLWRGNSARFELPSCQLAAFGRRSGGTLIPSRQPLDTNNAAGDLQEAFAKVASVVKPAVVNIATVHVESYQVAPHEFYFGDPFEEFFQDFFNQPGQPRKPQRRQVQPRTYQHRYEGMGSGVIIDPKGYIVTNEHVVRGADEIKVTLNENGGKEKTYIGRVVGTDPRTDLAVIKIKASNDFPYALLGDSNRTRVGDWAIAIGSPFGLEQTVTVGVVSAVRQSLVIEGRNYKDLLQTDAAINRGNSGGPLVNLKGEVVGINTAIYAPTGVFAGIGFAIPINRAKAILDELIEKGKVVRGWLGVEIAKIDDVLAKQFGLPDTTGALVNKVLPDSPAEKAGLQRGDVIKEFDGTAVKSVEDLHDRVAATPPDKKISVKVIRNGKHLELKLVTSEMPSDTGVAEEEKDKEKPSGKTEYFDWEGAKAAELTPALAEELGLPADSKGVAIAEVEGGSVSEMIGLRPGDIVREVNRAPTISLNDFKKAAKKIKLTEGVVFDVLRQGQPLYLSYKSLTE